MTYDPYPLPDPLRERVENWARWALSGRGFAGAIGGVEGRYRAPPMWEPPEKPPKVDILDALKLERAIVCLPMAPSDLRRFFAAVSLGHDPWFWARQCSVPRKQGAMTEAYCRSAVMVRNLLQRHGNA